MAALDEQQRQRHDSALLGGLFCRHGLSQSPPLRTRAGRSCRLGEGISGQPPPPVLGIAVMDRTASVSIIGIFKGSYQPLWLVGPAAWAPFRRAAPSPTRLMSSGAASGSL